MKVRPAMNHSVNFFEAQFQKQIASSDHALNPFETVVLPYVTGHVLDFGCGLGNLSVAMARRGCSVLALDASATAIRHLSALAVKEKLAIDAREADLRTYPISHSFDAIVAIGLLMFFGRTAAHNQLAQLQKRVRPGGIAAINVLIDGTTSLDMFELTDHCLFGRNEMREQFAGWEILSESFDDFPAPANKVKSFVTLVARKPQKHQG